MLMLGLLLGLAGRALAQAPPSTIYGLGVFTGNYTLPSGVVIPAGTRTIGQLNPSNINSANPLNPITTTFSIITNAVTTEQLVGLDVRPSTSRLYVLGYTPTTQLAQLYTLAFVTPSTGALGTFVPGTAALTAVGSPLSLNLQDNNRSNTQGLITNVGFDFNPRVDRIRVVAPNGTNYRLNPNTGTLAATDGNLAYVAGNTVGHAPYIGTAAYENSALGIAGTTLDDIDITNTSALLSTQAPPNVGTLNPSVAVTFQTNKYTGTASTAAFYPLNSPTVVLDLDIYYDRSSGSNIAYLVEARVDPSTTQLTSNLFMLALDSRTYTSQGITQNVVRGQAVGSNIAGQVPFFYSNIAAAIEAPKTWVGSTGIGGTDWDTGTNWVPAGAPTATDDVFIPGTGTVIYSGAVVVSQPTVSSTVSRARSVNLGLGAQLTTANGGVLSVYADFINNDASVAGSGTGTVALVGTASQDIGGNATTNFQNLSVGVAGATTSAPVTITRSLAVTGTLAIGADYTFTLLSNASGTAYVINNGTGTITGAATVQRYIDVATAPANAGMGYRHYSAPVATTFADLTTSGFTPTFNTNYNNSAAPGTVSPFPTVYGYNQTQFNNSPATTILTQFDKGFYSPASGTEPMVAGNGYAVEINGNQLVDFVGTLNNGNYSTPSQGRSSAADAGWQLLGNPYPSVINWDLVTSTGGLVNLRGTVYVVKSTGAYSGYYASYINNQATNGGSRFIPVGQGFFVQASTVGVAGNINFTNAQRVITDDTAPFQRSTPDVRPQLLLELTNGTKAIQTDIYFESGATTGLDNAYDAPAPPFLDALVLASAAGSDIMAINGLPALTGTVTVPLRLAAATAGTYTLRVANLANLPTGYHAFLRDDLQHTTTDLTTTPSVVVSLPAGAAVAGRFSVTFTTSSALATAPAALASLTSVYPNPAHGTATLLVPQELRNSGPATVQLLNTLGQVVLTRPISTDRTELPVSNLAAGIYTVRLNLPAGQVTKQLAVE